MYLRDIPAVFLNRRFLKQDIMWEHLEDLKVPQIWFCPNSMVGHQISPPIPTHNSVGSRIFLVPTYHLVGPQLLLAFPTTLQISPILLIWLRIHYMDSQTMAMLPTLLKTQIMDIQDNHLHNNFDVETCAFQQIKFGP